MVSQTGNTTATITQNTVSRALPLTFTGTGSYHYSFSTQLELSPGLNTITVTATDTEQRSGSDTVTVNADIAACAIKAELTWNTNYTDVDGHLIAPCYEIGDGFGDCYFGNKNPDWDNSGGKSDGDPSLDVDDTNGYGPEHIVLCAPPFNGIYQYKVHYWNDNGYGPSIATVKIYINDSAEPTFQASKTISDGEIWDCACIDWPSGNVYAGPCLPCTTPTPTPTPTLTPTPTPSPTPTPTPTPSPQGYTLTVYSKGCCSITVSGLPSGNQTVPVDGSGTFAGIPENTVITLTADTGSNCQFEYWWIDQGPSSMENPVNIIMSSDHTAEGWCSPSSTPTPTPIPTRTPTPTPSFAGYRLTVTSQSCCSILVTGLPGGSQTVPAYGSKIFSNIPSNTMVTLEAQVGGSCYYFSSWTIDGVTSENNPQTLLMYRNRMATAVCNSGQEVIIIVP